MHLKIKSIEVQNEPGMIVLQLGLEKLLPKSTAGYKYLRLGIMLKDVPQLLDDVRLCEAIGNSPDGKAYERKAMSEDSSAKSYDGADHE